jgi:hypothetical protein
MTARPVDLTGANCGDLDGQELFKSRSDHTIVSRANFNAVRQMAWVDVFNAVAWLLVVLVLQVEILMQRAERLTHRWRHIFTITKVSLYLVLAGDAVYWTLYGAFIDSWDAWLWLLAFVLIDLNFLGIDESEASEQIAESPTPELAE